MLVSAISTNRVNSLPYYGLRANEPADETTFSSLTPSLKEEPIPETKQLRIYESINEWKNFCHKQILGEKLNILA